MRFILEYKSYKPNYEVGDIVLIEYWYTVEDGCSPYLVKELPVTPVRIIDKGARNFRISHDVPQSKIRNAPEETINKSDIIDYCR